MIRSQMLKRFGSLVAGGVAACFAAPVHAQPAAAFPTKPVTIVTPFAPGSGPDVVLRSISEKLTKTWGQRVLVENRPGASGFIAIDAARKASPDGYTLLQLDSEHLAALPRLYKQRNFQPLATFEPVATNFRTPFLVVVPAGSSWTSMTDLISAAKAKPGQLNYGSWSIGSPGHLGGELLDTVAGTKMQHVPFKEVSQLYSAVGNGDLHWAFGTIASSQAAYKFGKIRYLAVAAPKRVAAMPDVPTVTEADGPAKLDVNSFVVLVAPRGVPPAVASRIHADVAKAVAEPDVRARFESFAFEPLNWSAADIVSNVEAKSRQYSELIQRANIMLD